MAEENGIEVASVNPGWIKKEKNIKYMDLDMLRIFTFFVINTPCTEMSSSGIDVSTYGWGKKVWRTNELKNALLNVASLERGKTFVVAKKTTEMKKACEQCKAKKNFHDDRGQEKIVIYKSRGNECLSIFNHIRNSFAHGRFNFYADKDNQVVIAMEDGVKHSGKFYVRSRMILKKSTLISWIDLLERKTLVSTGGD